MQDSCQTNWNFWQDKIKFCRTEGLSVIKLLSRFARNHRTFVRQTEIFCRTEWKFASFVRQSCSFRKDCSTSVTVLLFMQQRFHMWHLFCHFLFLSSPCFCVSERQCFVIMALPRYLHLYFSSSEDYYRSFRHHSERQFLFGVLF